MPALRNIAFVAALVAAAMLLVGGPATRFGGLDFGMAFTLMRWALYVGLGAAAVALVLLFIPAARRAKAWMLVAAIVLGLAAAVPPLALRSKASSLPYIHDISTDTSDPPAFVALLPERKASPNGADYGGAGIAAKQAQAYPDVQPRILAMPVPEAYARALQAARAMGWEIAAADSGTGRIEATATTPWFGFKDDVIVRIRPQGDGSRLDVRSVSRVGLSDIGANAARIREYLSKLN
jgi:hypothetical protein